LDCQTTFNVARVAALSEGAAILTFGGEGPALTALDETGGDRWSVRVPTSDLDRSSEGGVFGLSGVLYQIDARGRALWQWPGTPQDNAIVETELLGFCNARIATSKEGDLFVGTSACDGALRLLEAAGGDRLDPSDDFGGTLVARLQTAKLPEFERRCGNAWLDPGEECDGALVAGDDCATLAHNPFGELRCGKDCKYDKTDCVNRCGNGTADLERGEACDGQDLRGETCTS
jgi:hypothetical protein